MIATATDTITRLDLSTPEGKRFLRRVATRPGEDWHFRAEASDGWRVNFWRRAKPEAAGDSEVNITVDTDETILVQGRTGLVKSFSDSSEVIVPSARRAHAWGVDCRTIAALLAEGWKLEVYHNSGSTSSSHHGLAFLSLQMYRRTKTGEQAVTIGDSTFKDGQQIISGPVSVD